GFQLNRVKKLHIRKCFFPSVHLNVAESGFWSRHGLQGDEYQMGLVVDLVAGIDGSLKITVGVQQVGGLFGDFIKPGSVEFLAKGQENVRRKRPLQKMFGFEAKRAEEGIQFDAESQCSF